MRRIDLHVTDVMTTEEHVIVHGTQHNSDEPVEIVIPIGQIPAITGALEPIPTAEFQPETEEERETRRTKKGGK